jgi:DNA-binding transcriptional LysR family regulator
MTYELDWLRSWVEVVDSGGFARAALRIHLSQPRISAHVAQLEAKLGSVLIDRKARPLALTEDGVRFLPRARAILSAVDDSVSEMRSSAGTLAGRLTVGSFASASAEYLPNLLARIRQGNPALEVSIIDSDVQGIDAALLERRAHVALRPFRPAPLDKNLSFRGLWRESFVALAPLSHPILNAKSVRLEQILKSPVITLGDPYGHPTLGHEVWSALRSSGLDTHGGMVSHQPSTLAAMVRAGHGIGLLNSLAVSMIRTDGLGSCPVESPTLYRDVGVWWRADRPLSRTAQAFVQLALQIPRPPGTKPIDR